MWVPHKDDKYVDSKWRLKTLGAYNASVLVYTMSFGTLLMEPDDQPNVIYSFYFTMAGGSASPIPIGFDFTDPSMPGTGTRIIHRDNSLNIPNDFVGLFFQVGSLEANIGPGISGGVITFGANPFNPLGGCSFIGGQVGIPTVAANATYGYIIGFL